MSNPKVDECVRYLCDLPQPRASESPSPELLAREIGATLPTQSNRQRFQDMCLRFAKSYRTYQEKSLLRDLQVGGCTGAIQTIPALQKTSRPGKNTGNKLIAFLKEELWHLAERNGICKKHYLTETIALKAGYLEPCAEYLASLKADALPWVREPWGVGDGPCVTGWGLTPTVEQPTIQENPWPYSVLGDQAAQMTEDDSSKPEDARRVRPPDLASGRDLPAAYMLLALVHDWFFRRGPIVNAEIEEIVPDFATQGAQRQSLYVWLNEEETYWPGTREDLEQAWNYVKADLEGLARGDEGAQGEQEDEQKGTGRRSTTATHDPEYRSVRLPGDVEYTFTPPQAAVVAFLWERWERGWPFAGQDTILEKTGGKTKRLRNVFKVTGGTHPAWETLIVKGDGGRDRFGLNLPEKNS